MCSRNNTKSLNYLAVIAFLLWGCSAPLTQVQPSPQPEATPENVIPSDQKPEETDSPMLSKKPSNQLEDVSSSQKNSAQATVKTPSKSSVQTQEGNTATRELNSSSTTIVVETPNPQQEVTASQSVPTDNVFNVPDGLNLNAPTLRLQSSNQGIQVGDQFILSIEADQVKDLFSAPFYLKYDPQLLEFIGLTEGKFLNRDGKPTVFIYSVDPDTGQVIIGLSRLGDVGGISGSGVLALATFKAKNPGTANVAFQNVDFRDIQLEPVNVLSESGEVQVR